MRSGYYIGRLFGVSLSINWTWPPILLLVAWTLSIIPEPGWSATTAWGMAIAASVLLFASVLLHALVHVLVARTQGIPIRNLTLSLFGGTSDIECEPSSPREELLVGGVGSATSFLVGVACQLLTVWLAGGVDAIRQAESGTGPGIGLVPMLLGWVSNVNILLGVIHLLPGLPLDGGRILRSFLWKRSGDLRTATRHASWVGQLVAGMLAVVGLVMLFGVRVPLFGEGVGAIWLLLIAWFVYKEASDTYKHVLISDVLSKVPVSRLMRRDMPVAGPKTTLADLTHHQGAARHGIVFVVDGEAELKGLVSRRDTRLVNKAVWGTVTLEQVMTPLPKLTSVGPWEGADAALERLGSYDVKQLPVLDDGRLVGMVRRKDILRWLQAHPDGVVRRTTVAPDAAPRHTATVE